jgi:hypothetical protein
MLLSTPLIVPHFNEIFSFLGVDEDLKSHNRVNGIIRGINSLNSDFNQTLWHHIFIYICQVRKIGKNPGICLVCHEKREEIEAKLICVKLNFRFFSSSFRLEIFW